ncbi:membrane protein [Mycolicibacterium canariasense]|uniref:Membrane protein n=1 Tax=Mycolicibacterium canariasense TaxID=228230 RepID=A0A124E1C7_MYCCR|nr:DoxX family protein [Mycolicibacterium canariasense]MCV7212328.1 DoxX family protein [Mycolicibacterium canariasense]ORV17969.1 phosphoribosylaminoimidazolecarboxamide formyltransferase [Mycolicibacterium canariasense]GAS93273.1 membrane protein [Mycolicibacterium canariasense]
MASPELETKLTSFAPIVLSVFRIIVSLELLTHAGAHLFGWPADMQAPVGTWPYWYGGVLELITGALLLVGLFTRAAAFLASGVMAFAYFSQHAPESFWPLVNNGEPALLLCFAFFLLVFTGGGALAVDAVRKRKA